MAKKEAKSAEPYCKNSEPAKAAGIFIPGGLFVGMGVGFLTGNYPAGMFLGLGAGFILFGIFAVAAALKCK
jgi:F0F1-type ATP synthase assembly protein I